MLTGLGSVFVVSGLLEMLIPFAVGFYIIRRFGSSWKIWFLGALMFMMSLIRIPLNVYISQFILAGTPTPFAYSLLVLVPSFTAGIFEEVARYIGFKRLIKDRSYESGLTYGAGHGGVESMLIVGLNILSLGVMLLTNPGALPPEQLLSILGMPIYLPLIGVYERIMAMIIQIGLSIMVLESIRKSDIRYLFVAVGIHTMLNYLAVSLGGYGVFVSVILVTGFAIGLGYWAYKRIKGDIINIGIRS
jgi:uncharacterized membrane protein YhfC